MREIKFRAWDDKHKKWLMGYEYPSLGGFSMFGELMLFGEWSAVLNSRSLAELDTIKLMQYTGLKDKNGKDCYEGDIVKSSLLKFEWSTIVTVVMEFLKPNLGNPKYEYEIIGNIYENPELLTKQL